jgi:hypothetical protein
LQGFGTAQAHRRRYQRPAAGRGHHRRLGPGPRRRPAAAVESAPHLPEDPPGLSGCRLRRQVGHLGRSHEDHHTDRGQTRPAHLRDPAPPLGRGTDLRLDQQTPPHRPDYEQLPASHEAMIMWAMIALMTHRLTQPAELSDAHLAEQLTFCSQFRVLAVAGRSRDGRQGRDSMRSRKYTAAIRHDPAWNLRSSLITPSVCYP